MESFWAAERHGFFSQMTCVLGRCGGEMGV